MNEHHAESVEDVETIVIGGGQAGLAVGHELRKRGRDFVILDAHPSVGDAWRKRWDSLLLFTPARYCGLPGMRFPASGGTFPTKDQMAAFSMPAPFATPRSSRLIYLYLIIGPPTKAREPGSAYGSIGRHS